MCRGVLYDPASGNACSRTWAAFDAGTLHLSGTLHTLQDRCEWTRYLMPVRQTEWVVYAKRPFAGPQQVLDYIGRYTHRVAIANDRLLDIDNGEVRFTYKDYRADPPPSSPPNTMTPAAGEFIRRFLLHVLPAGFHRIRYYGFLGARHRRAKLARCRQVLGSPSSTPTRSTATTALDDRDRVEALTGVSLRVCPACHHGEMIIIERLLPHLLSRIRES